LKQFEDKVNETYPENNGYGAEYRNEIRKFKVLLGD
jgi:hypothetical protein